MRKIGSVLTILLGLIVLPCCASKWDRDSVTPSPTGDSKIVVERQHWGGGAGSTSHRFFYEYRGNRILVAAGSRGYPARVHWFGNRFVVLEYCGGNMEKFTSATLVDPGIASDNYVDTSRILFQLVTQRGVSFHGREFCSGETAAESLPSI